MENLNSTSPDFDFWDKTQAKSIQGICAVIIMLHHMAQKTCADWLPAEYTVHGLDPFLSVGYLMVSVFFFSSGYGLYKSLKADEDYLEGFIGRHFRPVILIFVITNVCFFMVGNTWSGYNWYIYAILYLYIAFYVSFKCFKRENVSIIVLFCFIAVYVSVCEYLVAGTWCYNTIGVFLIGLLFAKNREKIAAYISSKYLFLLMTCAAVLAVSLWGAEKLNAITGQMTDKTGYNAVRYSVLFLQFISAAAFSVLLYVMSCKIRLRNAVTAFLGSMTLELYLIHVLFVEMFGYCFVSSDNGAVCYIRSLWLYIPVVLILSIACAYGLSWVRKGAHCLYEKYPAVFGAIHRDLKKCLIGVLIAAAAITLFLSVSNAVKARGYREDVEEYCRENISFVRVSGSDIAYYSTGSGERVLLILRGDYDPCPTLTQKNLADTLGKSFRVFLVDLPGSGFSGAFTGERTAENICRELHDMVQALELEDFILLTENSSSVYAQYYVHQYPGEVNTVVNIDAETAALGRAALKSERLSVPEYTHLAKTDSDIHYLSARIVDRLGYKTLIWPLYQDIYEKALGWQHSNVAYLKFFENSENKAIRNERRHEVDNYLSVEGLKYPDEVFVVDFVSDGRVKGYGKQGISVTDYLDALCVSQDKHEIVVLNDSSYCIFFSPETIRENICKFMP